MKRIIKIEIITAALILFTVSSCIMNLVCIDGNGVAGSESRSEHDFTGIVNSTDADLVFVRGDTYSVTVEADQNLLEYYKTSVSGDNLEIEIENNHCVRSVTSPVIRITAPNISSFILSGSGNMVGDILEGTTVNIINSGSGSMFIESIVATFLKNKISGSGDVTIYDSSSSEVTSLISGSGDLTIEGEAELGAFTSTGAGNNYSSNLSISSCTALISGSGDIFSMVSEEIHATLTGSGNLYYTGNPQIYQNITGSGRIIRIVR